MNYNNQGLYEYALDLQMCYAICCFYILFFIKICSLAYAYLCFFMLFNAIFLHENQYCLVRLDQAWAAYFLSISLRIRKLINYLFLFWTSYFFYYRLCVGILETRFLLQHKKAWPICFMLFYVNAYSNRPW